MLRNLLISLSESSSARSFATNFPLARNASQRFVAGETTEDAIRAARELNSSGMAVTLDCLGESVRNEAEAHVAANVYLDLLDRIAAEKLNANVSLKLTQMGQDISEDFLRSNVGRVLDRAKDLDIFVRFDMEGSAYTQRTLDFHRRVWDEGYTNVGPVIQSYLRRSEEDVMNLIRMGSRVRLCKGAYREPAEVAFPEKNDVDVNYIKLAMMLIGLGNYPGLATHDERIIESINDVVVKTHMDRSKFEYQMLYGVRRDLQRQLVSEGYNVRVYVPFGDAWYPYLMRRMAERPANLLFILKAVANER